MAFTSPRESAASIDSEFVQPYPARIRKLLINHLVAATRLQLFALTKSAGIPEGTLDHVLLAQTVQQAHDLCRLMRAGAAARKFRFATARELVRAAIAEPYEKAMQALFGSVVSRCAPAAFERWVELEEPFSEAFSSAEVAEIDAELQRCPPTAAETESYYVQVMERISELFHTHLVCVGIRLSVGTRVSVPTTPEDTVPITASEWAAVVRSWEGWRPGPMLSRISDLLVTASTRWEGFRAQLQEHFQDDKLPADLSEPPDWSTLSEQSHYVVAFHVNQMFLSSGAEAQYLVRRMASLSRCLLDDEPTRGSVGARFEAGGMVLSGSVDHPAHCQYVALPLGHMDLNEINATVVGADKNVEHGAFDLPVAPFRSSEELAELERSGLLRAWEWLRSDDSTYADQVRRALDCYEAANSILHAHREVPTDVEEAWSLTALLAGLESLFWASQKEQVKSAAVCDQLRECLRRLQLGEGDREPLIDAISNAYKQRNALLHGSRPDLAGFDVASSMKAVSLALRETIQRLSSLDGPRG